MKHMMLSLLCMATLTGCELFRTKPEIEIQTRLVPITVYQPERPDGVNLEDVKFHVLTEENMDEKLAELRQLQGSIVLFAITPKDYENLAWNMQELRRYIRQSGEIILYYENATTVPDGENVDEWLERNQEQQRRQLQELESQEE